MVIHTVIVLSQSASPTILVFPHQTGWKYSDGTALMGASNARGYEKITIFNHIIFISLYIGTDAR